MKNKEKLSDLTPEQAEEIFVERMANLLVEQVLREESAEQNKNQSTDKVRRLNRKT